MQLRMSQPKTPKTAGPTDAMSQQMKIMQLISPAMVLFFGWSYAAGLALYWTVSSLFAMFQQYFVTGWGSLMIAPNLISNKSNTESNEKSNGKASYTGDQSKETKLLARSKDSGADTIVESGPIGSQLRTLSEWFVSGPPPQRISPSPQQQ